MSLSPLRLIIREQVHSLQLARVKRAVREFMSTGKVPAELTHNSVYKSWVKMLQDAGEWEAFKEPMQKMYATWMIVSSESALSEHEKKEQKAEQELAAIHASVLTHNKAFMYPGVMGRYERGTDPVEALYYEGSEYTQNLQRYASWPDEIDPIQKFAAEQAMARREDLVYAAERAFSTYEAFVERWMRVPTGRHVESFRHADSKRVFWRGVLDWLRKDLPRAMGGASR